MFKKIIIILLLFFIVVSSWLIFKAWQEKIGAKETNQGPLLTTDLIVVKKGARKLFLLNNGKIFREYHIALGRSPQGHKRREGDQKTPEGKYVIDWRNDKSIAYRSLHISYPNKADRAYAKVRNFSPGGDIMIHGIMNGYEYLSTLIQKRDWTDGCIAVLNNEMAEIWQSVKIGTKIRIEK